jgi:hypothetical protein
MAHRKGQDSGDASLVFVSQNNHDARCGPPPRLRNADNPGLYHGCFENRYGEQFVFTFDLATQTGTVSGGDLGWDDPKAFTLGLLDEALRSTQNIAAQIEIVWEGRDEASAPPVIDTALALGRLTGLTGKDEVIWLRACLEACTRLAGPTEGGSEHLHLEAQILRADQASRPGAGDPEDGIHEEAIGAGVGSLAGKQSRAESSRK